MSCVDDYVKVVMCRWDLILEVDSNKVPILQLVTFFRYSWALMVVG